MKQAQSVPFNTCSVTNKGKHKQNTKKWGTCYLANYTEKLHKNVKTWCPHLLNLPPKNICTWGSHFIRCKVLVGTRSNKTRCISLDGRLNRWRKRHIQNYVESLFAGVYKYLYNLWPEAGFLNRMIYFCPVNAWFLSKWNYLISTILPSFSFSVLNFQFHYKVINWVCCSSFTEFHPKQNLPISEWYIEVECSCQLYERSNGKFLWSHNYHLVNLANLKRDQRKYLGADSTQRMKPSLCLVFLIWLIWLIRGKMQGRRKEVDSLDRLIWLIWQIRWETQGRWKEAVQSESQ